MEILAVIDLITTSKQAWVYLLCGNLALLFTISQKISIENRKPKWKDLWDFFRWSIFVSLLCILVDTSPLLSIVIGLAQDKALKIFDKKIDEAIEFIDNFSITEIVKEFIQDILAKMATKDKESNKDKEDKDG